MRALFVGLFFGVAFATALFALMVAYSMAVHHFPHVVWLPDPPIDTGGLAAVLLGVCVGVHAALVYRREGRCFSWKRLWLGSSSRRSRS